MYRNYLLVAWRNLVRHKTFSLINVTGLAVAMACSLLMALYVADELSYDRFHANHHRIFRVGYSFLKSGSDLERNAVVHMSLAPRLQTAFPAIQKAVRLDFWKQPLQYGTTKHPENVIVFADSSFFDVFSFPFAKGSPRTALRGPNTAVVTQTAATTYFGTADPIGKVLDVNGRPLMVTGVLKDIPSNSHFRFDVLSSIATIDKEYPEFMRGFGYGGSHYTYLLLKNASDAAKLEAGLPQFVKTHVGKDAKPQYFLQRLTDIHLRSDLSGELEANGDIRYVYIFSAVALIILFIACINYTNLTTARALDRAREVGMRKVIGASRRQLVAQFLGESLLIALLALVVACALVGLAMPFFNQLAGKALTFPLLRDGKLLPGLLAFAGLLGVLAGLYPALLLSGFRLTQVLKGKISLAGRPALSLRKGLVVFQFAASIALITGTLLIEGQLNYIRTKKLGINPVQVVTVPLNNVAGQYPALRTELLRSPHVVAVGAISNDLVSGGSNWSQYKVEDGAAREDVNIPTMVIDYDLLPTMQARIIAGRGFSRNFPTDSTAAYLVNESAARLLGLKQPVGRRISGNVYFQDEKGNIGAVRKQATIIGVVQDFHFASLHDKIKPVVFSLPENKFIKPRLMHVRISGKDVPAAIAHLKEVWARFEPENPVAPAFMDEEIDKLYRAEARFLQVFTTFAGLAILIAGLGVLGLASLTTAQRTREIGIRKVLGASVGQVTVLLSKDFLWLVAVSNLLAWPVAWYAMRQWLDGFAYRTPLNWWVFVVAGLAALAIALLTVSFQSIRAALANPVESLRSE
jgi:putative ABC transport system permease protein